MIGVSHPKWTERPLLIVVKEKGSDLSRDKVLDFLQVIHRCALLERVPNHLYLHLAIVEPPLHFYSPQTGEPALPCGLVNTEAASPEMASEWRKRSFEGTLKQSRHAMFHMQGKIAKWWVPEDCVFVKEIPHTAAGKISKLQLRKQFKDYKAPGSKL